MAITVISSTRDGDYIVEIVEESDENGTLVYETRRYDPLPEPTSDPVNDDPITITDILTRLEVAEDMIEKLKTFVNYKDPAS